ncbi:hypothetical protein GCM10010398_19580 [Streptomyces fimbriatus]
MPGACGAPSSGWADLRASVIVTLFSAALAAAVLFSTPAGDVSRPLRGSSPCRSGHRPRSACSVHVSARRALFPEDA